MPKVYSSYSSKEKNYYKKPFYKTKGFYIILSVVIIAGAFVIWSITKTPASEQTDIVSDQNKEQEQEYKAVVNFVRGEAEYLEKDGSLWKNVSFSQKIEIGSTIRTAEGSKLEMTFPDGSLMRMAENTVVTVQEISPADIILFQESGNAYHRVNPDGTAIYKVAVNDNEFTALGTAYNTESKNAEVSELTVVESKVKVKVYKEDLLINMRTIEEGNQCTIDKTKEQEEMIETKLAKKEELLENEWIKWNKEQDAQKDFSLGMFSDEVKLSVTKPGGSETTTNKDSYTIEGSTEKEAVVKIAGVKVTNDEGSFSHEVELSKGENKIEIIAALDDKETKKEIIITYDEDADDEEEKIEGFTLSAKATDNDVKLTWEIDSSQPEKGFKLLRSSSANPEYPGSDYKYIIQNDARVYTWQDLSKGTHHFRACLYTSGGSCKAYSNNVSVTIEKEEEQEKDGSISLSGSADGSKAKLSWSVSNLDAPKGFKVVKSTGPNPVYPGNDYKYLSDPGARSLKWDLPAGTYHFRVCEYTGSGCGVYSNDVTVTVESTEPKVEGTISLSGSVSGDTAKLTWSTSNLDALKGFKVVKSQNPNPVYPGNDYKYLSDPASRSVSWSGLSAGTYHFRTCQYLGGSCGVYSNDITLTVEGSAGPGTGTISLSGSSSNGKAYLNWSTSGSLNLEKGYKVVMSESPNPVYPGNEYHYLSNSSYSSDIWTGLEVGKTYYFRVCQYLGGSCGTYSNNLSLEIK